MERQKITTCLWFENRGEEAVRFYLSVFGDDAGSWRRPATPRPGRASPGPC